MKTKHLLLLVTPLLLATCKENEPEEIQPTALFSFAQKELTVSFTNVSQNAQTYTWDFGDGTTSTDANPVHTYSKSGTWQVVLIAKNIIKTDSCIQNITISQAEITPTPNFSYTTSGLSVTFKNTSINATSYSWDFGDGQTSTANNPLHTYKSHGVFRVTLTASNGSKSNYVSQSITLKEQTPQASFTYTTTHPLKVILKNTSTNAISYEWDFGDGSTSTEKNPTHRYNGIGVY
ncbi:MAG: PKD domain-containing protein [Paludibacteraceae bacterium]|nr:PKD domain-containing protein [Paludibacteraceae bacterium]